MNKYLIAVLFMVLTISAQFPQFGEARGLFMSFGIGPRIPIGDFSDNQNIGVGFNLTLSYTDNNYLPVFLYASAEFQHYPGRQDFYKRTDYSSFSSNVLSFSPGIRFYLPPLIENVVLLMPVIEGGVTFALFEKYHQFKIDRNRRNFVEEISKTGLHVGVGVSMFLMDVITSYNYLHNNQYLSFDLKIRIPVFVIF